MDVYLIEGIQIFLSKDQLSIYAELIQSFWNEQNVNRILRDLSCGWFLGNIGIEHGYLVIVTPVWNDENRFTVHIGRDVARYSRIHPRPYQVPLLTEDEKAHFMKFLQSSNITTFFIKSGIDPKTLTLGLYLLDREK